MSTKWMAHAGCQDKPLEWFFEDYIRDEETYDTVSNICGICPVKFRCLDYGKKSKSYGVWGGQWLQYGVVVKTVSDSLIEEDI